MMFTDDEALAISVGSLASRQLGLAKAAPAVESAQAKLERVLHAPLKTRLRAVSKTVTLDLHASPSVSLSVSDNDLQMTLSTAAHRRQRVHLHYRSGAGVDRGPSDRHRASERDFDAYGLAWRA